MKIALFYQEDIDQGDELVYICELNNAYGTLVDGENNRKMEKIAEEISSKTKRKIEYRVYNTDECMKYTTDTHFRDNGNVETYYYAKRII